MRQAPLLYVVALYSLHTVVLGIENTVYNLSLSFATNSPPNCSTGLVNHGTQYGVALMVEFRLIDVQEASAITQWELLERVQLNYSG